MNPIDLSPEARAFVDGPGGISFTLMDGARGLPGYVTRDALEVYFGAATEAQDGDAVLQAFDRHVETIHRLARRLAHGGQPGAPTVVLTVDAIFRVLTRE